MLIARLVLGRMKRLVWVHKPILPVVGMGVVGGAPGAIWVAVESCDHFVAGEPVDPQSASATQVLGGRAMLVFAFGDLVDAQADIWAPSDSAQVNLRTFSLPYGRGGKRSRGWLSSVDEITETDFARFLVQGPRTTKWLAHAIVEEDFNPTKRHLWWRLVLNVGSDFEWTSGHCMLSQILEHCLVYDGLSIGEDSVFGTVAMRCRMWEDFCRSIRLSVDRDDTGSSLHIDERTFSLGEQPSRFQPLVSPLLDKHIAD